MYSVPQGGKFSDRSQGLHYGDNALSFEKPAFDGESRRAAGRESHPAPRIAASACNSSHTMGNGGGPAGPMFREAPAFVRERGVVKW